MIDIKGAKFDLLKKQAQYTLSTLAHTLKVDVKDLHFKISAELEFYFVNSNNTKLKQKLTLKSEKIQQIIKTLMLYDKKEKNKISNLNNNQQKHNGAKPINLENFEEEDGDNQFEVQFTPSDNPLEIANNIVNFKKVINDLTSVNFQAKPFSNLPSSSLHFHISVFYKNANLFSKDNPRNDDEYYYLPLYWSIAGMLEQTLPAMKIFAPTENCYERYHYPSKNEKYIHYPTGVCWGFNNRTCAIRIPKKPTEDPYNCRIEHRVCSSMADPFLSLFAILVGMNYGIINQLECPEPVFGNAFDIFNDTIKPLPKTIEEAEQLFQNGMFYKLKKLL